jgi:hypothetical protein
MPWGGQGSDFQEWSDRMAGNDKSGVGRTGSAWFGNQFRRLAGSGPFDDGAGFTFALPQSSGHRGEAP